MSSSSDSTYDTYDEFTQNPTRDMLEDGLMSFMKSSIDRLDEGVEATRISQEKLRRQLNDFSKELTEIENSQKDLSAHLKPYIDMVEHIRCKFTIINNILQNTHDRLCNLLHVVDTIKSNNVEHFNTTNGKSSNLEVVSTSKNDTKNGGNNV